MNSLKGTRTAYEQHNKDAAAIILVDVAKYGGEGSLMVRWAKAVLAGQQSPTAAHGDLFDTEAA